MAKYRKKPVVIEATQWFENGNHPLDGVGMEAPDGNGGVYERMEGLVVRFFRRPDVPSESLCKHCQGRMLAHGWIDTKEGGHIVCPGDWIITGIQGERYPCKPDIFACAWSKDSVYREVTPEREGVSMLRILSDEEVQQGNERMAFLYGSRYTVDNITAILMDTSKGNLGMYESDARAKAHEIIGWLKTITEVNVPDQGPRRQGA
jgi:hypothetical protein